MGTNTVEAFQSVDKNQLIKNHFLPSFLQGDLQALTMFVLLTYADLKHHKVLYWFGFPALLSHTPIYYNSPPSNLPPQFYSTSSPPPSQNLSDVYSLQQRLELAQQVARMRRTHLKTSGTSLFPGLPPYFVWFPTLKICQPLSRTVLVDQETKATNPTSTDESTTMGPVAAQENTDSSVVFGFFDPNYGTTDPGWPLRNLVAYLSFHLGLGGRIVSILCCRPGRVRRVRAQGDDDDDDDDDEVANSLVELDLGHDQSRLLHIRVPTRSDLGWIDENDDNSDAAAAVKINTGNHDNMRVAGWELNPRGRPGPRSIHLRPLLDETHLAIQAADLNLQLMKWRMIPNLQVSTLQTTKVLLLGAGTLGCNVARVLLGWGVRNFTFVDYGTVGYSNPVRQPLFTMADCQSTSGGGGTSSGNGVPKAVAAAQALKLIAADVQSQGIVLSIPMPGHVETKEALQASVTKMDELVQECDVVFLLTDTRESRWLPTVLAAAHEKPLINAALGLDSWLVMRHGGSGNGGRPRLGCYFCNDVVAPENSTRNRTLDQQCTVTRPGLAPIASAMAVELLVSLLHHPLRQDAPAPSSRTQSSTFSPTVQESAKDSKETSDGTATTTTTPLGLLPHQIRGSLVTYTMMTPTVPAFAHCTGCAPPVIDAYRIDPIKLVFQTCASPTSEYLEDLTGLTEFRAKAAAQMEDVILLDDDDDDNEWDTSDDKP